MKKFTLFLVLMFATSLVFTQVPPHNPNAKATITNEQIKAGGHHSSDNPSSTVFLDFEGLGDLDGISQFYNGGTSSPGGFSGTNYGVYFSANTLGLIDSDAGGTGNFANEPSPNTAMFAELTQGAPIMNVPAGFTTGFSFYYTAAIPITVNVYDGLDGTGTLLASQPLVANYDLNCIGDPSGAYCHWDLVGVAFSGTAKSASFTGEDNFFIIDNITFTPANPCSIPTLSEWGLIILALLFLAAEMVYLRRRQYSFATAGGADVTENRKSLFNRRSYFIILAVLLGIAMVVFTVEILFSIAVPVRDIVGALVSSVILAYIIHLLNAFRKE